MAEFDVLVIGAGPGGYVCAIRAAQLGKRVAIVEKRGADTGKIRLGGTCLNVGCIPSKALLDSSEHFSNAKNHFSEHGIKHSDLTIDVGQMMKRKERVVTGLVDGISYLMKKNKITVLSGIGTLIGEGKVSVNDGKQSTEHQAKHIVLAMGSAPIELPFLPFNGDTVVSSDQAIAFDRVPERLLVVGGGVIGLELGSVWSRLGSQVRVIEFLPQLCPFLDADVSKELQKILTKQGMTFDLESKVSGVVFEGGKPVATAHDKSGKASQHTADKILVAVGRRPFSDGLAAAGVALDEKKRVKTDDHFRTNIAGVYAIGDLVAGPMLAHKAEEEGVAVAEIIAGESASVDHLLIPNVIYTWPEVASVGMTENDAKAAGREIRVGKFAFAANGRAKAAGDTDGFVKIITDKATDRIIGGCVLGARASDLIAEIVAVMSFGGSSEDIARTCHAHPTFSEAIREASLDALGRVIHG